MTAGRRVSFYFLSLAPFLTMGVVMARPLRVPGVYQSVGVLLCLAIVAAVWTLGLRGLRATSQNEQQVALAGALWVAPFVLVALLWVGIVEPWMATPPENLLRYLVLMAMAALATAGSVVLAVALRDAGERVLSSLGAALALLAGSGYLVWTSLYEGFWVARVQGDTSAVVALQPLVDAFDVLLFASGSLTYAATAALAASMGNVKWLGRWPTRVYVGVNVVLFVLLSVRGVSFPDPNGSGTPWYLNAGFVAGIPAVPWLMPFLLGVVLLRRAGIETR